jgi:hypothetical protein
MTTSVGNDANGTHKPKYKEALGDSPCKLLRSSRNNNELFQLKVTLNREIMHSVSGL